MRLDFLRPMGEALRARRGERKLTQRMLASRVGRSTPRISELERDLVDGRIGKDRLGLLVEMCDALDLTPILVPRERVHALRRDLQGSGPEAASTPGRAFDELFVDLSEDGEADGEETR